MRFHIGLVAVLLLSVAVFLPVHAGAEDLPCGIFPTEIDFGSGDIGDTTSVVLTMTNFTGGTLSTGISLSLPPLKWNEEPDYSMPGTGAFSMAPGETREFILYFHPQKEGRRTATVKTGSAGSGGCGNVPVVGEGYRVCYKAESAFGFGEVVTGKTRRQGFAVYGIEGRTVRGRARISSRTSFKIVDGGGDFVIGPGEYHEITVEFAPFGIGYQEATLETGIACGDFHLSGAGTPETLDPANPDAAIDFHVRPRQEGPASCGESVIQATGPCLEYVTSGATGPGGSYNVYVLLSGGNPERGFAGADFGIDYLGGLGEGVDVINWTFCGALEFPTPGWPGAESGNLITWNHETDCQQEISPRYRSFGVHALVGILQVEAYTMDVLRVIPRPVALNQGPHVSDCDAQVNQVVPSSNWGSAVFSPSGAVPGCNPCLENCFEPVRPLCQAFPAVVRFGKHASGGSMDTTLYVLNPYPKLALSAHADLEMDPSAIGKAGSFSLVGGGGDFSVDPGQIHEITVRYTTSTERIEGRVHIEPLCEDVVLIGGEPLPAPDDLTPVTLTAMNVNWDGDAAAVRWQTAEFVRDAVYAVHRQDAPGAERRVLMGTPVRNGTVYTFMDPAAPRSGAQYWVSVTEADGNTGWYGPMVLSPRPFSLILGANHPNPFPSQTAMSFEVPSAGRVMLSVYDLRGREVVRLVDRDLPAGRFDASWDGRDGQGRNAPAGIYLLRLVTADGVKSRKLTRIG